MLALSAPSPWRSTVVWRMSLAGGWVVWGVGRGLVGRILKVRQRGGDEGDTRGFS